jgi:prolyl-tRNA editing enzyme YbaK/EbsC (Cys-tRNA(Pro) deacylase)
MRAAMNTVVVSAATDRVREATGFAIGGVPPVGYTVSLETFIDEDLLTYDIVYAAAGTPTAIFPIAPHDLVRATGGRVVHVARPQ